MVQNLSVPKEFFIKEREAYDDWLLAFWRELFQNSLDAGADQIHISINEDKTPCPVFGELIDQHTKHSEITFTDNGSGMSAEVLNDVYFSLGASTKANDEGTTGGFGRARMLTCFGNARYSILSQGNFVEGIGSQYTLKTIEEALKSATSTAAALELASKEIAAKRVHDQIRELSQANGHLNGTHLTVAFDPNEYPYSLDKNATAGNLRQALDNYLRQSTLSAKVFINGEPYEDFLPRPRKVRDLFIHDPNSNEKLLLGTLRVAKSGKNKRFSNRLITRISGAYTTGDYIPVPDLAVLELDPKNHRKFLTSNRDGFRGWARQAVIDLIQEITVDNVTALQSKDQSVDVVREGSLGYSEFEAAVEEVDFDADMEEVGTTAGALTKEAGGGTAFYLDLGDLKRDFIAGVPTKIVREFLKKIENDEPTFLDHFPAELGEYVVENFKIGCRAIGGESAISQIHSEELKRFLFTGLQQIYYKAEDERRKNQIAGLHNVVIKMDDGIPSAMRRAAKQYDPANWSADRGKSARMLLEAWTTACEAAVRKLVMIEPQIAQTSPNGRLVTATGFHFAKPEDEYVGDFVRVLLTKATHSQDEEQRHRLLLNPVDENGRRLYNLSSKQDMSRLLTIAIHETAHCVSRRHNQEFAYVMTTLMEHLSFEIPKIVRKMQANAAEAGKKHLKAFENENEIDFRDDHQNSRFA